MHQPDTDTEAAVHPDNQPDPVDPPPQEGGSYFGDSSGPLFSLYSKIAEEEDNKLIDRWQKDADGILIFTGLFSAAVAALLAVSVQDLTQDPQDVSVFYQNLSASYLANIYQVLVDPNVTVPRISIPSTIPAPPSFTPPRYAVWVNSLWFLSLVISLTCALLATSLHQWARRYIRHTQPARRSPEKRARMRKFFANGMNKMHLPRAVEVLPTLIHLSLFLFLAGLVVFLHHINSTGVFIPVISCVGLSSMVYVLITLMPIFRPDSPYYAPLSSTAWLLHAFMLRALFTVLAIIAPGTSQTRQRFRDLNETYDPRMFMGVLKAAEGTALERSSEIDIGILEWTIGALGEDDGIEKFFEAIPGFFNSQMVKNHRKELSDHFCPKFVDSLEQFLSRTLLSNSVSDEVKIRRLVICMKATKEICGPRDIDRILRHLSHLPFDQVPQSIQTAQIIARWCSSRRGHYSSILVRQTVARILPQVREHDGSLLALAKDYLDLPEGGLRDNSNIVSNDNSVLLSILIDVTRHVIHTERWDAEILSSLSKFDIHNTAPELQIEFCALWNEIVLQARDTPGHVYVKVLRDIRQAYITLHQGTNAAPTAFDASTDSVEDILKLPSSYPPCDVASHRQNSSAVPAPRPDDDAPSQPSLVERQAIPGSSTAPRRAEGPNIIRGPPSSADHSRPHSVQEPIEIAGLDPNRHASREPSHQSPHSSPPTAHTTANTVSTTNQTPRSVPDISSTLQTGSLSPPIIMPAPHSGAIPVEHPSSVESARVQPDRIPHPLRSSSSSLTTARPQIAAQVASVSNADVTTSSGPPSTHDDTLDPARSTPMQLSHHENLSEPSTLDIAEPTMPPGDYEHD